MVKKQQCAKPTTVEAALECLSKQTYKIVAGGTDVMVAERHQLKIEPTPVLFINHINDLKRVYKEKDILHIGAACTYTQLINNPLIPNVLKEAMKNIAAPAIRNQGTIGGNICNASPAGDTLPLLYVFNAKLVLKSLYEQRTILISDFIKGVRKIDIKDNEMLTEVLLEAVDEEETRYCFEKVGSRKADAISKVSFAGSLKIEKGTIKESKFAFGAVGMTVVRDQAIEKKLEGEKFPLNHHVLETILQEYNQRLRPIDDQRSTANYRKKVAINLLKNFLTKEINIFKGNIVYAPTIDGLKAYTNGYIVVQNGKVLGIKKDLEEHEKAYPLFDYTDHLIIPGFVDLHVHASQYDQIGLGLDLELIDWLNEYTFKLESKFSDVDYAKHVYTKFTDDLVRCGTTRASIFATIHKESTKALMAILAQKGIGAYVGKVNMDQNSADDLCEETEESLKATKEWIEETKGYEKVKPVITPRFSPACTKQLLKGLGDIALENDLPIQSHVSENKAEVEWVKELFPDCKNYTDTYDVNQLLTPNRTLMAHGIYLTEEECQLFKEKDIFVVHCPDSNMNIKSGIMPIRKYLELGLKIGLGSDVGGGSKLSIASAIVSAIQNSKLLSLQTGDEPLKFHEAFYLATKGGGEFFGKVGSFEKGYAFDALVIDMRDDTYEKLPPEDMLKRFIYRDITERIKHIYCDGKRIK